MAACEFDRIGKYHIIRKEGEGGFGSVYEGWDQSAKRSVAIKILAESNSDFQIRFQREASITAKLSTELREVAQVYEFSLDKKAGVQFLAQEYLSGVDLKRKIEGGHHLPVWLRLSYLQQIAAALSKVHSRGVIHRDLKPGNIRILHDHRIKLMDFGIAKIVSSTGIHVDRVDTQGFLGTPLYTAPEQLRDMRDTGASVDVYSFGSIAYELLSGRRVFEVSCNDPTATLKTLTEEQGKPTPLQQLWPACPSSLADIVHGCLDRNPEKRPQMDSLASKLLLCRDEFVDLVPVTARASEHKGQTTKALYPHDEGRELESHEPPASTETHDMREKPPKSDSRDHSRFRSVIDRIAENREGFLLATVVMIIITMISYWILRPGSPSSSDHSFPITASVSNEKGSPTVTLTGDLDPNPAFASCSADREPGWDIGDTTIPQMAPASGTCLKDETIVFVDSTDLDPGDYRYKLSLFDSSGKKIAASKPILATVKE